MSDLTQETIRQLFSYSNGKLVWKIHPKHSRVYKGTIVNCVNNVTGYVVFGYRKTQYRAHRQIWIMHNGDIPKDLHIDHINGNRSDNRLENLRVVTRQENGYNSVAKGYSWNKDLGKWAASITANGKKTHLGYHKDKDSAKQAYLNAKEKYHRIELH